MIIMKKVKDFMNKKVIYVKPEDSVFKVAKLFSKKKISGAPVVKRNKVVGVVSESDIVKFMSSKLEKKVGMASPSMSVLLFSFLEHYSKLKNELQRISKIKVKDIMSKKIVYISPDAGLFEAASMMEKKDVNRLPVIDNGKLVGIIARADLIRFLVK